MGAIGWADPSVVAHLRLLESAGYRRSDFEEQRLKKAADALEERAADRQRWRERRAEQDDPGGSDDGVGEQRRWRPVLHRRTNRCARTGRLPVTVSNLNGAAGNATAMSNAHPALDTKPHRLKADPVAQPPTHERADDRPRDPGQGVERDRPAGGVGVQR